MRNFVVRATFLLLVISPVVGIAASPREMKPVSLVGRATQFNHNPNWRAYYWREDITFLLKDENSGKTWRIISRDVTPYEARWRLGPTYLGLKVNWKAEPRVKVIGVQGIDRAPPAFYDLKLDKANVATAFVVLVEVKPRVWKEFYVNNWFHKWGEEADRTMHAFFADKKPPYDIYGWIPGKRAPFSKRSQQLIKQHEGAKIFRGFVRSTKDNPFGFELEVTHLLGKDPKTNRSKLFIGDPKEIPKLDAIRSKSK